MPTSFSLGYITICGLSFLNFGKTIEMGPVGKVFGIDDVLQRDSLLCIKQMDSLLVNSSNQSQKMAKTFPI